MRGFVAGGTGAIGKFLVPHLVETGHEVVALVRTTEKASFCGRPFAREGRPVKTEEEPLDPNPPARFRKTSAAIRYLEETVRATMDLQALAPRYGIFYGPGTAIARDGSIVDLVRKRRLPVVGDGAGIWSFIHIQDAARATVAAVSRGAPGIYNVVDDEPVPVSPWLPFLADAPAPSDRGRYQAGSASSRSVMAVCR